MPEASAKRLIIFTRYPEPGKTKTRLIPVLGKRGAAELQRRMTEHLMTTVRNTIRSMPICVEIRYEGGNEKRFQQWLGPDLIFTPQHSGNIGERMQLALDDAFHAGAEAVVIIGTDIPDISPGILINAFDGLKEHDLIFGPAADGGYYLIGARKPSWPKASPHIFREIAWGTTEVISQTLQIVMQLELSYLLLDTLDDVDRPEDLHVWRQTQKTAPRAGKPDTISVIIPALNEADNIGRILSRLKGRERLETIVVDGGSDDGTAKLAGSLGAKVMTMSAPSKARQMNAGAAAARGNILLFLHADTLLPENFTEPILQVTARKNVAAGAFQLGIDADGRALRLIEKVANWRSRHLQAPYGDQAIFVTRALFKEVGGFPDIPIMEDFEFIRRLKKKGKIVVLGESVKTSPRRWLKFGIFNTWLINQIIIAAYFTGIPPERLSRWYRREKGG
jgi:rSAM/selenodomain-associated transferase 2/rSAM/selenodomain-associated transferase 1